MRMTGRAAAATDPLGGVYSEATVRLNLCGDAERQVLFYLQQCSLATVPHCYFFFLSLSLSIFPPCTAY